MGSVSVKLPRTGKLDDREQRQSAEVGRYLMVTCEVWGDRHSLQMDGGDGQL